QCPGVPGGELDLGDHRNPLGDKGLYQGNRIGYARALHDQSRIEDLLLTVGPLLPRDSIVFKNVPVLLLELPTIGNKDLKAHLPAQQGRTHATFPSTKYHQTVHLSYFKGDNADDGQKDPNDPKAGNYLAFMVHFLLIVMVQGGHQKNPPA